MFMVEAVAQIRVADDERTDEAGNEELGLNKEPANIAADLQDSLQGNMRVRLSVHLRLKGH